MTGRDLILYILENGLENEPVVKDGMLIGFESEEQFAARLNVGVATVRALVIIGDLESVTIGNKVYIPASALRHVEHDRGETI
jgi:excisionase family DNA binding protein